MRTASPSAASPRGLSTLSSDLQFEGSITGGGDLQIDGAVKGDVRVGRLIVGETGAVEGNVSADYVEVRGRVVGGISGKQVKLIATAYVDGDITAEQMSIDIGAYFQGRVLQGRREAEASRGLAVVHARRRDEDPSRVEVHRALKQPRNVIGETFANGHGQAAGPSLSFGKR